MSVWYESQCGATCDICGESEYSSVYRVNEFKVYLRGKGWSIGKMTTCPACKRKGKSK